MGLTFAHYYVMGLMALFLLKAFAVNRNARIRAYDLYLNTGVFILIAIFLAYQFWKDGLYTGIFAVCLGGLAIGKYFYDMRLFDKKQREQDKKGDS